MSADATPDALQVLLEHPSLLSLLREAIDCPATFTAVRSWESVTAWQARAVREALRKVSDPTPSTTSERHTL